MSHLSFTYYRNQANRARWAYRWAQQGGSFFYRARNLQDLRTAEERWRGYELLKKALAVRGFARRLHRAKYGDEQKRRVVNLAQWRINRARKQVGAM